MVNREHRTGEIYMFVPQVGYSGRKKNKPEVLEMQRMLEISVDQSMVAAAQL